MTPTQAVSYLTGVWRDPQDDVRKAEQEGPERKSSFLRRFASSSSTRSDGGTMDGLRAAVEAQKVQLPSPTEVFGPGRAAFFVCFRISSPFLAHGRNVSSCPTERQGGPGDASRSAEYSETTPWTGA